MDDKIQQLVTALLAKIQEVNSRNPGFDKIEILITRSLYNVFFFFYRTYFTVSSNEPPVKLFGYTVTVISGNKPEWYISVAHEKIDEEKDGDNGQ